MAKRTKNPATARANLSVMTLRVAHEALQLVSKPNAQSMFNCAQAMAEIEAILAALPQGEPASAPEEVPAPAPVAKTKGNRKRK